MTHNQDENSPWAVGMTANKRFICFLLNINLDLSKKTKKEEWYGKK